MPKKKVLPTIVAEYDEEGVSFICDGEPIEDMEFSWEDLADPELVTEVAEELIEYIDSDELEDVDNPVAVVRRVIHQLRKSKVARRGAAEEEEEAEEDYEDEEED
ncbi:MAG: hypothetical protein Kow0092_13620 [Deferrisomatales bacterium]